MTLVALICHFSERCEKNQGLEYSIETKQEQDLDLLVFITYLPPDFSDSVFLPTSCFACLNCKLLQTRSISHYRFMESVICGCAARKTTTKAAKAKAVTHVGDFSSSIPLCLKHWNKATSGVMHILILCKDINPLTLVRLIGLCFIIWTFSLNISKIKKCCWLVAKNERPQVNEQHFSRGSGKKYSPGIELDCISSSHL